MEPTLLIDWWKNAWAQGLWPASWRAAVQGHTPAQAAWRPGPGRHSIWQIVAHMLFWREHELAQVAGKPRASDAEIAAGNFPEPTDVSEGAWRRTVERLKQTQDRIAALYKDPAANVDRLSFLLPHDCYHMGQINYLRALQGLKPVG